MKKRINIFQPDIRPYRSDFFNLLAEIDDFEICIYYGKSSKLNKEDIFSSKKFTSKKILTFNLQKLPLKEFITAEINIVCFDLHWPIPIIQAIRCSKKIPVLFWGHGLGKNKIATHIKKYFINKSGGFISYSEGRAQKILSLGVDSKKIFIANNTLIVRNSEDCSSHLKKHFIYVGRLQFRKKIDVLIKSFAQYIQRKGELDLVIIGGGDDLQREELNNLVKNLDIENRINFIGSTEDETILKKLFSEAIAYVSPGDVGLGVLHAFSYGVPVITFSGMNHGPEFEAIINKKNGLVINEDITNLTNTLINISNNHSFSQFLGKNAFETYSNEFSPYSMVTSFKSAITKTLEDHKKINSII